MTKRKLPTTPGARRSFQLKYPRAVDQHYGLAQVDDLFDGTMMDTGKADKAGKGS